MNNNFIKEHHQEGIISLAVILSVGMFALALAVSVAAGVLSEMSKNQNSFYGDKSFYTADGAAKSAMRVFLEAYLANPDYYRNLSGTYMIDYPPGSLLQANGSTIDSLQVTGTWPYYEAYAQAQNAKSTRRSKTHFTVFPEGLAFNFAVFSNDDLNLSGNSNVDGNIFSNGDIDFVGNSATVDGDASAVGCIEDCDGTVDSVDGVANSNVLSIPPPVINSQPYIDFAVSPTGQTFDVSANARAYLRNRNRTGVFYVNDTTQLDLSGSGTRLSGSLITKGDLRLSGGRYDSSDHNRAVIIVEGDLIIAGGAEIHGIVYVKGSTTFGAGGGTVVGSLISAGGVTSLTGNTNIIFDADLIPNLSDLVGLEFETTEEPRITKWEEF